MKRALGLAMYFCIGCGDATGTEEATIEDRIEAFCEESSGCTARTEAECVVEVEDVRRDAEHLGCTETFEVVIVCLEDIECVDGQIEMICQDEILAHAECVGGAEQ